MKGICKRCKSKDVEIREDLHWCYPDDPNFSTHSIQDTVKVCVTCDYEEIIRQKKVPKQLLY